MTSILQNNQLDMRTLCEKCYNNNYGNCYESKKQYLHVFDEEDCDKYIEDEDCGPLDEDMGYDQDEP